MKYRTTIVAFGVGLLAAIMAGCSAPSAHASFAPEESFNEIHKQLSNGTTVTCLVNLNGYGDAISCDWTHAK